ncbi:PP2C family protein-serine/threonine phosphatase [Ilumatobacter nonamiensis]|uniref:PP2C family protein-serine/threonine phosphatase n=1 Tax=Ilumatobacter nonamiensis TaxID=467093 RepID=UPI00058B6672|nr:protein phosphatase 2C domain-containing protein [Ilumatobacter nonamiensis]
MVADEATLPTDLLRSVLGTDAEPSRRVRVGGWDAASEAGRREQNEDAWGHQYGTFVVADGMGGRPGGAIAARSAVEASLDVFTRDEVVHPLDWSHRMGLVNDAVTAAGSRAGHDRVGAAIGIVQCRDDGVVISHVGDVRVYRLRAGVVELLTRDHSVVHEIRAAGVDPAELDATAGRLGALTSFLGEADTWRQHSLRFVDRRTDDRFVICTDGVYRSMRAADWIALSEIRECRALADAMVERARTNSSRDDRTALVLSLAGPR